MPLLAGESHRGWLSGRFLTSWFWIKKIATNMSKNARRENDPGADH